MATEQEANQARNEYSDFLRQLGAHAIAVDTIGKSTNEFAVQAFFEKKPKEVPKALAVTRGKKKLEVPLVAKIQRKFRPE